MAAARVMPGVWGVFESSSPARTMRMPCSFQSDMRSVAAPGGAVGAVVEPVDETVDLDAQARDDGVGAHLRLDEGVNRFAVFFLELAVFFFHLHQHLHAGLNDLKGCVK